MTTDIGSSEAVCTTAVTPRQPVQSSSENDTSLGGSDVAGAARLFRVGNISLSVLLEVCKLPALQPLRNRLCQRDLLADGRLLSLLVGSTPGQAAGARAW